MLIFDQLKKDDPQLRFLATVVFGGMVILFAGLWWVQIVSSSRFQKDLETQSVRTVRIPSLRGKILDRDGRALAENAAKLQCGFIPGGVEQEFPVGLRRRIGAHADES